ncbi:GH15 family glucan-1,4-alpha-glucosidase [Variovorax boronicumulans]|jgi:GH15 family glucan-1,4-alpha-glucosidase|uniref:GH15 family glucan-1,4-alpha-glucosidase n=2 Tax=Variovorax TaxID=34072 RepID=A0AAW8D224_9BURK|nr:MULTISPECIES: glycoside hydrolase family 15 protein [Variovorax]ADU35270.1 glycoside hydrolase 15-related protein [Variovorax paradoxus EPS]MDP9895275.1 GH15 family glucan-1,4-alpha-glucosidase [Variovorax boronicumulans]MDP9996494.1 GH15 family glucan-1,4-alpha-glucosidase [Variovorax boronicumulans]MDQ0007808.1 GH15 family glucan-1,4-alpha-glucosidase [Variovorax boronicumulans]MDQ0034311.1 GH15 family glucan-1,4-alpha-glucosidase [Variovorax boronicumulans]
MSEEQLSKAPEDRAGEALADAAGPDDRAPVDLQAATAPGPRGFAPPADPSLDVGVIGNCAYSALIDARGRAVWCCLPRFDGDPVFNALLHPGEGAGAWSIDIEDFAEAKQWYEPNTAVLRTQLFDSAGQGIEITDFAPRFYSRSRYFRPLMMVRRVRPIAGAPRIRVSLDPRFQWGASEPIEVTRGSNHIRYVGPDVTLRLNTDASISHILARQPFVISREYNFMFGVDETLLDGIADTARKFEQETIAYWRTWSKRLAIPFEYQDAVIRAAITLKLSLYEDTGAIVAAMTTSIPEAPGSQRNWDYRYCWLRDAFFVVRALNSLSEVGTMEDYLRWLGNVVIGSHGEHIQPLYGIGLERELPESFVEGLPGYRGMGPVRVGNQAQEHFQHDVYGNIVLGAAQAFHDHRLLARAGVAEFPHLEAVGERAVSVYGTPDAGMWELRTRARVHTSSALMSWAACDRLAKIARTLELPDRATYWHGHAARMKEEILAKSWCEERQAFAESFGGHELDASILLMVEVGLIDARDPRFISTVDAMEKSLCDGPYMRRYEAADDFGKPETAFNICTFWRIDALAKIGRKAEARQIFETMLAARNPLGLLSEDTHPVTGEMWGNFPQTYSMVGIINAAVRLSAPWDSCI